MTFGSLLRPEDLPGDMGQKVKKAPLSHKILSVQFGLFNRIDGCGVFTSVVPMMKDQYKYFNPDGDEVKLFICFVSPANLPELSSGRGSIIEMFPAIKQDITEQVNILGLLRKEKNSACY